MPEYCYSLQELHKIIKQSPDNPGGIKTEYSTFRSNMIRTLVQKRGLANDGKDDGLSMGWITESMFDNVLTLVLARPSCNPKNLSPADFKKQCFRQPELDFSYFDDKPKSVTKDDDIEYMMFPMYIGVPLIVANITMILVLMIFLYKS